MFLHMTNHLGPGYWLIELLVAERAKVESFIFVAGVIADEVEQERFFTAELLIALKTLVVVSGGSGW